MNGQYITVSRKPIISPVGGAPQGTPPQRLSGLTATPAPAFNIPIYVEPFGNAGVSNPICTYQKVTAPAMAQPTPEKDSGGISDKVASVLDQNT